MDRWRILGRKRTRPTVLHAARRISRADEPALVKRAMGFEQLGELRDRLRAQAKPAKSAQSKAKASPGRAAKKREPVDPEVEAIWRLQRHFPLAFPKSPAPKVPLKQGILEDAQQHLERLGITAEQLKQAIATWCQGNRYWSCMVEDVPRLDQRARSLPSRRSTRSARPRAASVTRCARSAPGGRVPLPKA